MLIYANVYLIVVDS